MSFGVLYVHVRKLSLQQHRRRVLCCGLNSYASRRAHFLCRSDWYWHPELLLLVLLRLMVLPRSDGTTNFVHGFPFSCVSIGLLCNRRPVLGVIYNPFLDHLVRDLTDDVAFRVFDYNMKVLWHSWPRIVPDPREICAPQTPPFEARASPFALSGSRG